MDAVPLQSRRAALRCLGRALAFLCGGWCFLPATLRAALKPPITVLVEDAHGGSDIKNEYNFGSAELGRILTAQGCKVESTRDYAKSASDLPSSSSSSEGEKTPPGMGKGSVPSEDSSPNIRLTRPLLDRYRIVICNGRFARRDVPYAEAEILAIADWVRAGGGLLVASPGPRFGDGKNPFYLNPLLKPFGLEFADRNIDATNLNTKVKGGHPIMRGLSEIYVIHGVPVLGPPVAEEIAWVDKDCVLKAMRAGSGRVIAFGGGSAFMNQALNSQVIKHSAARTVTANTKLLINLVHWLSGEEAAR